MVEIEVQGLKELQDRLLQLPDKLSNNVLASCLGSAALVFQKEAQNRVVTAAKDYKLYGGQKVSPGWLRGQIIKKRVRQTKSNAETIVTFKDVKHAYFWRFLEFGTSKMQAKPFMRPAFEAAKEKALQRFEDRLKERLDKEDRR
jgi:HK97 gp10 family phage protein